MLSQRFIGFALASCLIVIPTSSGATPIVDQNFSMTPSTAYGVLSTTGDTAFAQTLTVGIAGVLTGADLLVFDGSSGFGLGAPPASDVSVQIRALLAGVPTDIVLAAGVIPAVLLAADPHDTFTHVDFATGITVVPGETLALTITGIADGWVLQVGSQGTYAGGEAFDRVHATNPWQPFTAIDPGGRQGDFLFRTYVDTAAVPEPGTLTLVGIGLAAGLRRCRRGP